ncbi:HAD family hydrolase [Paraconexibacter sp.]|uniref:HAD family hydrolase n=1 Tax=Paraconexibacter sp. TaxID=2949640 RepID=UPI003564491D
MIRAVVCDFGGVLTTSLHDAFKAWERESGIALEHLGQAMVTLHDREGAHPLYELECGRITEASFHERLGAQMSADLGRPVDMSGFTETYFRHLHPNEELLAHLGGLRARGVPMALLTNNVREWEPRWRAMLPVDELFDVVVDSAYVGMRKPDEEIYRLTCERFGHDPQACLFVDDFAHNCDAAKAVGLTPVWHRGDTAATIATIDALLLPDA